MKFRPNACKVLFGCLLAITTLFSNVGDAFAKDADPLRVIEVPDIFGFVGKDNILYIEVPDIFGFVDKDNTLYIEVPDIFGKFKGKSETLYIEVPDVVGYWSMGIWYIEVPDIFGKKPRKGTWYIEVPDVVGAINQDTYNVPAFIIDNQGFHFMMVDDSLASIEVPDIFGYVGKYGTFHIEVPDIFGFVDKHGTLYIQLDMVEQLDMKKNSTIYIEVPDVVGYWSKGIWYIEVPDIFGIQPKDGIWYIEVPDVVGSIGNYTFDIPGIMIPYDDFHFMVDLDSVQ